MHHLTLHTHTETQAHMEDTSFVICIHVSLHCRGMFKPHFIKRWLPCFLYSHMLPIRSRQTGSLPKLLHSHVQQKQDTLWYTPPKESTISKHSVFSAAICRALLDGVCVCHWAFSDPHPLCWSKRRVWLYVIINSNLLAAHTWWRRDRWGAWCHLCLA